MNGAIDFAEINRAALAAFPAVLARILPGGKRVGAEIVALNPRRADRRLGSFKVNRYNGRWADFATGDKGGDPISLVAYLADVSQGEAAQIARPNARNGNRGAPSWMTLPIPSRLSRLPSLRKGHGKVSNPDASAPQSRLARRPTRNPARWRPRGSMVASPMASGAM